MGLNKKDKEYLEKLIKAANYMIKNKKYIFSGYECVGPLKYDKKS